LEIEDEDDQPNNDLEYSDDNANFLGLNSELKDLANEQRFANRVMYQFERRLRNHFQLSLYNNNKKHHKYVWGKKRYLKSEMRKLWSFNRQGPEKRPELNKRKKMHRALLRYRKHILPKYIYPRQDKLLNRVFSERSKERNFRKQPIKYYTFSKLMFRIKTTHRKRTNKIRLLIKQFKFYRKFCTSKHEKFRHYISVKQKNAIIAQLKHGKWRNLGIQLLTGFHKILKIKKNLNTISAQQLFKELNLLLCYKESLQF